MASESGLRPRRSSAVIAFALALGNVWGCVSPPAPSDPIDATVVETGETARLRVDRAIVLLDASGSMEAASRFLSARNLARSFVGGMPEDHYDAAVVTFGGDVSEIFGLAPFNRDDMGGAISRSRLMGKSTDVPAVLAEVQNLLLERAGRSAIVLFSDGMATRHGRNLAVESTLAAATRLVKKTSGEVCFYTIQSGHDPAGTELMQNLATATPCGSYRHADSLANASSLHQFQQTVFVEPWLPGVGAPAPKTPVDRDRDGVEDETDQCPDTPTGAHVDESGCWLLDRCSFDREQFWIRASQYRALDEVAAVLALNPDLRIRIDGHTDARGTQAFNQVLSERRADAVRRYLEAKGIEPGRLSTRGYGMRAPVANNDTKAGMATNRRCQMTILK